MTSASDAAPPAPNAVSLFAGAGGMDVGLRAAGFELLACVEVDPRCCATLRAAKEREGLRAAIVEQDIRTIDPEALAKEIGVKPGELDLLAGGPPCQAFSQIGKKEGLDDERGLLLFQMIRFAKALRPKLVLVEQVKGLLSAKDSKGKKGGVFEAFLADFEALGYKVSWRVLNAAEHGVAQARERVFVVARRPSLRFAFPKPTHAHRQIAAARGGLRPFATVGAALEGLGQPAAKGIVPADSHGDVTPDGDRRRIVGVPEGEFLARQEHLPAKQRGALSRKDTTKYLRLSRLEPSNTLRCGEIFFHPTENRYLTPREYMRLHGFPDDYLLVGPIRGRSGRVRDMDQHRQVANAVPPPVARALGDRLRKALAGGKSAGKGKRARGRQDAKTQRALS